jgi:hypothetical protein
MRFYLVNADKGNLILPGDGQAGDKVGKKKGAIRMITPLI